MSQFNTWNHLEFNNNEAGLFLSYENKNGAKIAAGLRRIFPSHGIRYAQSIELVEAGPLEGSIVCQTPAVFSINCGELPSGATYEQAGIAGVWYAKNGDLVLKAPHGTVRIEANNIELISDGNPADGKGNVSLSASGSFRTDSDRVAIQAGDVCSLNGENELDLNSTNKITCSGEIKLDEGHDILTQVASYGSGSKTPTQFARNIAKLIDLK